MLATDPTTQSNYWEITTTHVHFDWDIDWTKRIISGSATHSLTSKMDSPAQVIFDTQFLDIKSVEVNGVPAQYTLREPHEVMGSALAVSLDASHNLKNGDGVSVTLAYNTTEKCAAIGWLEKELANGREKVPFPVFPMSTGAYLSTLPVEARDSAEQGQIYARSLAPLQDTPSVKITYSANVRSTLPALCSALRVSPPSESVHDGKKIGEEVVEYKYNQPIAIPSYLIALASGNLVYKPFDALPGKSWKTGAWAEPETIDASYWEFHKDTAHYVEVAENLVTPYELGVYDVLVLPPSFPYGGMENACLTFLTPTLLAGDRSLVDVVAHEASHSWFGNNVTTADSGHFWLNEGRNSVAVLEDGAGLTQGLAGFTTYLERILQGELHGSAEREFSYIIGRKALTDALKEYENKPKYQRLVIPYTFGEDPDDAYSSVPYEKGSNFLLYLERQLGGLQVMLPYLKDYVNTFRGQSIRTDEWQKHLFKYFSENGGKEKLDILNKIDFEAWLHGEGLDLPAVVEYDTTLAQKAYDLAKAWNDSRSTPPSDLKFSQSDLKDFSSNQIVVFLETLQSLSPGLPGSHLRLMSKTYSSFNTTGNAEIRSRWYGLVLQSEEKDVAQEFTEQAAKWIVGTEKGSTGLKGRMKFCRPGFKSIHKVDSDLAVKYFESNKQYFHPIAAKLISKDLGLNK
ncbi:hypothetical protein FRC04_003902 [Tulasnella sp. 424]|nr:hypothetical protein FRC04_003902 [Tulasnella sp. 424]KAG8964659.1 hypothetical protein FRC05_003618 [Tulasnella sp. 425]